MKLAPATLRTTDERFKALEGYPFDPLYLHVDFAGERLRLHYLDEGPVDGPVVLLLHGTPTWSYLYRKVVPLLVQEGCRCIVPDLIGFGRSDKPVLEDAHTYAGHVATIQQLIDATGSQSIVVFGQDWGALIALRLVAADEGRFGAVVISNSSGLPTGDELRSDAFYWFQKHAREVPELPIGQFVAGGCVRPPGPAVTAGYDAPFPEDQYKLAPRIFPSLVPTRPEHPGAAENRTAWRVLERWQKPFVCAYADKDNINGELYTSFVGRVPTAELRVVTEAGHFLQEDQPAQVAESILHAVAGGAAPRSSGGAG